jgi:hypothetical protein
MLLRDRVRQHHRRDAKALYEAHRGDAPFVGNK